MNKIKKLFKKIEDFVKFMNSISVTGPFDEKYNKDKDKDKDDSDDSGCSSLLGGMMTF